MFETPLFIILRVFFSNWSQSHSKFVNTRTLPSNCEKTVQYAYTENATSATNLKNVR